jgi:PAS domain S-box-containing protein
LITDREKLIDTRRHCKDLSHTEIAVQSLDYSGMVLDVSPAWLKALGYQREEVIGRHFMEFLDKTSLLKIDSCFPKLKDFGYVDDVPLGLVRKDRSILPVHLTGTSLYGANGRFVRTFCEITPVSQPG